MPVRVLLLIATLAPMAVSAQETRESGVSEATRETKSAEKIKIPPPTSRDSLERSTRELLQKLPPEKRRQVLDAMKKVWADDDVRASREALRQATETYRRTLKAAMEETNPEVRQTVRPLLDRLLKAGVNPSDWADSSADPKSSPIGPPRFLRLLGLSGPAAASLSPTDRQALGAVRERVMNDPRVRQAAAAVAAVPDPPRARAQAMQELRRITRTVTLELDPGLRDLLEKHSPSSR